MKPVAQLTKADIKALSDEDLEDARQQLSRNSGDMAVTDMVKAEIKTRTEGKKTK